MITTTEEELADLFRDAILDMTPRTTYEGAEEWKWYDRPVDEPSRTRRFTFVWGEPVLRSRGTMAGNIFEHEVELAVRTDYAGQANETQYIINDDGLQLRDELSRLKGEANGLLLVEPLTRRVKDSFTETSDVKQVDHRFRVRFMRSISP